MCVDITDMNKVRTCKVYKERQRKSWGVHMKDYLSVRRQHVLWRLCQYLMVSFCWLTDWIGGHELPFIVMALPSSLSSQWGTFNPWIHFSQHITFKLSSSFMSLFHMTGGDTTSSHDVINGSSRFDLWALFRALCVEVMCQAWFTPMVQQKGHTAVLLSTFQSWCFVNVNGEWVRGFIKHHFVL